MKDKQQLPTPQDLAQLAALVFPACEGKKLLPNAPKGKIRKLSASDLSREENAIRTAALIWLHAGEYCEKIAVAYKAKDKSKIWDLLGDAPKARSIRAWAKLSDPTRTVHGLSGASNWMKHNATAKKDQALTPHSLKGEFDEFDRHTGRLRQRLVFEVEYLQEFLAFRTMKRSRARTGQRKTKSNSA